MKVLAIETSCDETAAAVVEDGRTVLSSVVSSQVDLHARFGGVVPEVAGRAHLDLLTPVVDEAMERAGVTGADLDAVAATIGPGLIGSLLVGVSAAKAYSLAWRVPFVGVNHLEGHLHAAFLEEPDMALPSVVLLVSGGHTMLIHM
ncbi:MAG: tRNA (adenosine(37)-N6)-threonylcarbamoyltransferase complex transferase subunit TsaD, partial [Acidimicrobiales bacterium]